MKNNALIATPKTLLTTSVPGILSALAFAVLLLGAGFAAGRTQKTQPPVEKSIEKPQFALLVKADDIPPADPSQQFREYSAWINDLKKERWTGGEALHGKAWRLRADKGKVETVEHTLKPSPDELSGYFLYEADNAEEALKIAQTCPHLKYAGTLELREIFK
ncbi:MAG: hypothetical protein SFV22_03155 [Saprospiraceae bacterium]|nr:hypothetical protein [Saprospiraceae bacterium]